MSEYLVTGGAGFIGSHIVEALVKRGNKVRVLDNFSTGKRENIASFLDDIELIEGDIRNLDTCHHAVENVKFVIHQAAFVSVPQSIDEPILAHDININGTLNLLIASRDAVAEVFVFASSAAVYGNDPRLPKKENIEGAPLSPYALGKLMGERYCQLFSSIYGLSTVCFRYFNIFGPRQDPISQYAAVIPNFITKMLKGESPTIFGDGEQSRDFLYVSDVVRAVLFALENKGLVGETINLASGIGTTINELVDQINIILESDIDPVRDEPRPGDILHSLANITKARKMLKYEPLFTLKEGLQETINWYKRRK
jgi:UDP-glucose 4-epimerase